MCLQVTWIGYPNSTGLPAVTYRLTDALCDPLTTSQAFAETLVRLPGCFLVYTPPVELPPVGPLPALANGFVTFGSFNALAKITPAVMRLWAGILARVPHARLLLKNKPFACAATRAVYLRKVRTHMSADSSPIIDFGAQQPTAGSGRRPCVIVLCCVSLLITCAVCLPPRAEQGAAVTV